LPGRRARGRLTISSAPGFAARWLLPRLPRFTARFPEVSVEIQTSLAQVDLAMEGFDAAIRMAPTAQATEHWTHLLAEGLVPVCAPALREQHAGLSPTEFLAQAQLIHLTSTSADWAEWSRLTGHAEVETLRAGLRVDTSNMALEAATLGLGVALGRTPLIDPDIESGRLVRVFDEGVPSGLSYWLITMSTDFQSDDIKAFRQWLLDEVGGGAPARKRRISKV